MGFFKRVDINEQVRICKSTPGAILVDVREPSEFKKGSIPDAVNIPHRDLRRRRIWIHAADHRRV